MVKKFGNEFTTLTEAIPVGAMHPTVASVAIARGPFVQASDYEALATLVRDWLTETSGDDEEERQRARALLALTPRWPNDDPLPEFPDLLRGVERQADGSFIYAEGMISYDPEQEDAHDVVEPEYFDALETIAKAGYVVDYENSGCDHDSFWVQFRRPAQATSL